MPRLQRGASRDAHALGKDELCILCRNRFGGARRILRAASVGLQRLSWVSVGMRPRKRRRRDTPRYPKRAGRGGHRTGQRTPNDRTLSCARRHRSRACTRRSAKLRHRCSRAAYRSRGLRTHPPKARRGERSSGCRLNPPWRASVARHDVLRSTSPSCGRPGRIRAARPTFCRIASRESTGCRRRCGLRRDTSNVLCTSRRSDPRAH